MFGMTAWSSLAGMLSKPCCSLFSFIGCLFFALVSVLIYVFYFALTLHGRVAAWYLALLWQPRGASFSLSLFRGHRDVSLAVALPSISQASSE